ncbi:MAG: hypothetical protein ABGZ35_25730 [Planctomycetaceae bacterium]|jgi:hypothetical protein
MPLRTELCVLLLFACAGGCALFRGSAADQLQEKLKHEHSQIPESDELRVPVKRIVRLNSSVIAQPISKDRVRQAVWLQMCESCLRKPESRRPLNQNGFRVGVSQPPYGWAMDSLLSTSQSQSRKKGSGQGPRSGHMFFSASGTSSTPIVIPDGSDSLIEIRRAAGVEIPDDVVIPGLTGIEATDEIRCILRLTTVETGDDWTLLRILPELQFGRKTMRLTVKNAQDHLSVRQKTVPLFEQQFEIKLRNDDVVVVGYQPVSQWTTGRFFFQSDPLTGSQEYLLVLQLSQIESVKGRASVQVDYRKY